ncbi:hypothetical protein RMATCC62417_06071 [Rhizopus microsporus]|nr:hypothetical protein RMATCC62417_06071 [Rhizopus microsporus]
MEDMNNIHLLSDEHRHYYYYGYDHLSQPMTEQPHHFQPTLNTTIPSPIEPNVNQFQTGEEREVKPRTSSSASLPSHNMRWTPEEDALLLDAIRLYGYGSWKAIADHVKTRNALQCKNHARQRAEFKPKQLCLSTP